VLSSGLVGRGTVLRDDEWGISGKIDLLLAGPNGEPLPIEYKRAWEGYEPGTSRRSHEVQLAIYFVLLEGDPRIQRAPAEGWIRYVDARGQVVPGGEVRILNTPEARVQALTLVELVRRAKRSGVEVHRTHHSPHNCRKCGDRTLCGEARR
jgi:CRISPR/Cas system-associated exonuclease Cas4 (RecB family)